jgi:short-subunit dehydrogenase
VCSVPSVAHFFEFSVDPKFAQETKQWDVSRTGIKFRMMKSAIVIGASSGIGRELTILLDRQGYRLGIAARRTELLETLAAECEQRPRIEPMDVSSPEQAVQSLQRLIRELAPVELIVLSAGTGAINQELDWQVELQSVAVNVQGFTALADIAMQHLLEQKSGHLVGITSLAALRGSDAAPAYYASKAYQSNYLQGLRKRAVKSRSPITVTEIQPGLVQTAMAIGDGLFWVAPVEKAAAQILKAIQKRRPQAYITRRWRLIAWLLKWLPDFVYNRL